MFKVYLSMSPPIFSELFRGRDICYNLRSNSNFAVPHVKSVFHGSESISYLGPKIWNVVPLELKELTSFNAFKKGIKKLQPKNYPCKLCKQYVSRFHFKYFRNSFLTLMLFLTHFKLLFASYTP